MKTYGDLLTALITHYEYCIKELPFIQKERDDFLNYNHVECGVCWASSQFCDIDFHRTEFIKNFTSNEFHLCQTPEHESYEDAKKYLQIRVDRMKELFPKWENVEL